MLDGFRTALARSEPDAFFERDDEDLSTTDKPAVVGLCCSEDCIARRLDKRVIECDLHAYVWHKGGNDLLAAVDFFRLGPSVAGDVAYRDPGYSGIHQGFTYLVELILPDYCYQ